MALGISDALEGDTLYSLLGSTLQPTSMLHKLKAVFSRTVIGDVETANHVRCRGVSRHVSDIDLFGDLDSVIDSMPR